LERGVRNPMKAMTKVVVIAIKRMFSTEMSSRAQIATADPTQTPMMATETQGYFMLFQ